MNLFYLIIVEQIVDVELIGFSFGAIIPAIPKLKGKGPKNCCDKGFERILSWGWLMFRISLSSRLKKSCGVISGLRISR